MRHRAAKQSLTNAIGMKNIYMHVYQDIYGSPPQRYPLLVLTKEI